MATAQSKKASPPTKRATARAGANNILGQIGQALEAAGEEARQLSAEYRQRTQEINRRRKNSFGKTLWLDLKVNANGSIYAYWRVMYPVGGTDGGFKTEHIRRNKKKGAEPYPWKKLQPFTDDQTIELVRQTERKVRHLQRITQALVKARQLVANALQEDEDDDDQD